MRGVQKLIIWHREASWHRITYITTSNKIIRKRGLAKNEPEPVAAGAASCKRIIMLFFYWLLIRELFLCEDKELFLILH